MAEEQKDEYILGTGNDESERLASQHRIWSDVAVAAWKRAGLGPGSRVVDLGCGPGYASLDLAQLILPDGELLAIDESPLFVQSLKERVQLLKCKHIHVEQADVLRLPEGLSQQFSGPRWDAIYCRWLLCWLPDAQKALKNAAALLKPGGKIIIHDYFNWNSMTMAPRSPAIDQVIAAAYESFKESHADLDLGGKLLGYLDALGFDVLHFDVTVRAARGGGLDATLAWPLIWWRVFAPKLVERKFLDPQICREAMRDLDDLEKNPNRFFLCPPVFEFIAQKR